MDSGGEEIEEDEDEQQQGVATELPGAAAAVAAVAAGLSGGSTSAAGPELSGSAWEALEALCSGGNGEGSLQSAALRRLQPRGLLNPGNLCFMNSVFQVGGGHSFN